MTERIGLWFRLRYKCCSLQDKVSLLYEAYTWGLLNRGGLMFYFGLSVWWKQEDPQPQTALCAGLSYSCLWHAVFVGLAPVSIRLLGCSNDLHTYYIIRNNTYSLFLHAFLLSYNLKPNYGKYINRISKCMAWKWNKFSTCSSHKCECQINLSLK